jgi:hypothetical protein
MNSDVATRQDGNGISLHMRPVSSTKIYPWICPRYKLVAQAQVIKKNVDQDLGHTTTGV